MSVHDFKLQHTKRIGYGGIIARSMSSDERERPPRIARRVPRKRARSLHVALALMMIVASAAFLFGPTASHEPTTPNKAHAQYVAHDPIIIYSEDQLRNSTGVTGGSGTADDPYVISGWDISTENIGGCIFLWRTTSHYVIRDCHVHCADAVCIEVQDAPNGTIENCVVDDGSIGIFATGSSHTNITGNTVTNMTTLGICVGSSAWVNVTGNTATDDGNFGMALEYLANVICTNNVVSDNDRTGLDIFVVANVTVTGNNFSGNGGDGVFVNEASDLLIEGNNITSNLACGLNVTAATSISISHNRFIANHVQAIQTDPTGVLWDDGYPGGGNYWSDYGGVDLMSGPGQNISGGDGIGDTQYVISASASDRYPLMSDPFVPVPEFVDLALPMAGLVLMFAIWRERRVRIAG
jgi:parallel beta-helix repeat protein